MTSKIEEAASDMADREYGVDDPPNVAKQAYKDGIIIGARKLLEIAEGISEECIFLGGEASQIVRLDDLKKLFGDV